jgi:chaperonin GroES
MTPFDQIPQGGMDPSQQQGQPQGDPMSGGMQPEQPPMEQQQPPQDAAPTPSPSPEAQQKRILDAAIQDVNLARKIEAKKDGQAKLDKIAQDVMEGFNKDKASCEGWRNNNKEWLKIALLTRENKTFPWPNASNIKFPLLATAAMQFSARAYPTLVPSDNQIVKSRVVGNDPQGQKAERADRISKHMSYQIMHKMPCWEEDMDRLLMVEAILGVCFKKTYKDAVTGSVTSRIVYPQDLIINYWAKSLEEAYRKTEILYITNNEYESKIRSEEFLDIGEIGSADGAADSTPQAEAPTANSNPAPEVDESTPHTFLACHTFYDIDEDGYAEPVVIYIHEKTQQVVRIVARWDSEGMHFTADGKKLVCIDPIEYFTDFQFLPNPDGSVYGLGFGSLLGPLNESVNTLINQLVDSGTLNNLQSGFIAKGLRMQMKQTQFIPGEWKSVNASGDDLNKSIFPLPTKEPSNVLFELMNMLIQSGNQLASVAEIMVGKMPGQNTPASTTQETVDQAMKVFTAIYKRNYRALLREFRKIYVFNRMNPDIVMEEEKILGIDLTISDYDGPIEEIVPAADPSGASKTMQMAQLQQVMQTLLPLGTLNPMELTLRNLKLIEIPDAEKLVQQPPPPPPDPKIQTEQIKQQTMQQKAQQDSQLAQQKMQLEQQKAQLEIQLEEIKMQMKQEELKMKLEAQSQQHHMDMLQTTNEMHMAQQEANLHHEVQAKQAQIDLVTSQQLAKQEIAQGNQAHQQKMSQTKQQGDLKAQQMKQQAAAKPAKPKGGK